MWRVSKKCFPQVVARVNQADADTTSTIRTTRAGGGYYLAMMSLVSEQL